MKVSLLQMKVEKDNIGANEENFLRLAESVTASEQPDVLVLPEMWSTGYYPSPPKAAAVHADRWQKMMSEAAARYNVNIVGGSIINERDNKIYNTCFCYNRTGKQVASYDKIHLFSPGGENKEFAAGSGFRLFKLDDVTCGAAICYDLRFPELMRHMTKFGAKVIFLLAEWPKSRINHWRILTQARAVENQIFLVAANAVGEFGDGKPIAGTSLIIGPWGDIIGKGGENEGVVTANLDLNLVARFRRSLDTWSDVRQRFFPAANKSHHPKHSGNKRS